MNDYQFPVANLSEKEIQDLKAFEQQFNTSTQNKDTILIAYTKA